MGEKSFVSIAENYFKRYPHLDLFCSQSPHHGLEIIIVIPIFNEKNVISTLESLFSQKDVIPFSVEIIAIINHSISADPGIKNHNHQTFILLSEFAELNNSESMCLFPFLVGDLAHKHAGVGWGRKIGMDLALKRFLQLNKNGLIVGLDADTTVEKNYLNSIYTHFNNHDHTAVSIHFEHPLGGEYDDHHHQLICNYELHLRYYKNALSFAGFPFAFHTVGSAFALTALSYARQGGMNRRKAGEDFYFINKLIKGENFGEITNTKVIPSSRISDRVPFGTGRAMLEAKNNKKDLSFSYSFNAFLELKKWVDLIKQNELAYEAFPKSVQAFLNEKTWLKQKNELLKNTVDHTSLVKRFFIIFDAFWVLKFVHFFRDHIQSNEKLLDGVNRLLQQNAGVSLNSELEQLKFMRNWDKKKGLNLNP